MRKTTVTTAIIFFSMNSVATGFFDTEKKYLHASYSMTSYDGLGDATGFVLGLGVPLKQDGLDTAVEFGYANLGEYSESESFFGETFKTSVSANSVYVVYRYNHIVAEKTKAFGIFGLNQFTAKAESGISGFGTASATETSMELMYGFGVSYSLNEKASFVGNYVSYEADTTAIGASVNYNF